MVTCPKQIHDRNSPGKKHHMKRDKMTVVIWQENYYNRQRTIKEEKRTIW